LQVVVVPTGGGRCTDYWTTTAEKGGVLQLNYSQNSGWVKLTSTGSHLEVTANNMNMLTHSSPLLRYGDAGGYLKEILVDSKSMCTFTSKDDIALFLILDF